MVKQTQHADRADPEDDAEQEGAPETRIPMLLLGALGVVYGDIGTSPLYTMREAFGLAGGLTVSARAVLGVLSLVFWALLVVVTVKYVPLITRADTRADAGILSLATLLLRGLARRSRWRTQEVVPTLTRCALLSGPGPQN